MDGEADDEEDDDEMEVGEVWFFFLGVRLRLEGRKENSSTAFI